MTEDNDFVSGLAIFLSRMSAEAIEDAQPTVRKAKTEVQEPRDTTNPRYITQLLTGILRGVGHPANIQRVYKRIADEVHWDKAFLPWRRSPFWLVLRVVLQTTLIGQMHQEYKSFMVYLLAKILQLAVDAKFPSDMIHVMHAKLSRRMTKLHRSCGPINNQLLKFLHATGRAARNFRDEQWKNIQKCQAEPLHWAPETLDFEKDTVLSLTRSRSRIDEILTDESEGTTPPLFHPNESSRYYPPDHTSVDFGRGVNDLEKAIQADPALALADFEEAVQTCLEDWVQRIHDNGTSCASLAEYFRIYSTAALKIYQYNTEEWSVMLLTLLELWMAIDRLAIAELPLLRDYSPEVSPALIEPLLLRTFKSTQRGICIMTYCSVRANNAPRGSLFSDNCSFSIRYFQSSPQLMRVKSEIIHAAQSEREAVIQDFLEKKQLYENLMRYAGEQPFRLP